MKKSNIFNCKALLLMALLVICTVLLAACSGDPYETYATAYKKLWVGGGINSNISADLKMESETRHFTGNFKVDSTKNIIYYEMETADGKTVQFSDGTYLYTQQGENKIKYRLGEGGDPKKNDAQQTQDEQAEDQEIPEFNTSDFLNEFSSMFEASKIKELGLFDPIQKAVVTKTTKNGDVYTLEVSDAVVKMFVNKLAVSQSESGDTVEVTDMKNFKYTATIKNGIVTSTTYSGDVTVKVPGSLMSSGEGKEYQVNFNIVMDFVDPGKAVTITLPSTDGYEEISGL